jgi:hypothetical protein
MIKASGLTKNLMQVITHFHDLFYLVVGKGCGTISYSNFLYGGIAVQNGRKGIIKSIQVVVNSVKDVVEIRKVSA